MTKVLEIGAYAAGYAGRLFAQHGYDVVRIESTPRAPAYTSSKSMDLYLHANKRRFACTSPELLDELANAADIVICEGSTANEIEEQGFDSWHARFKVAITPFGRTGPYRNYAASQNTLLAMGGYTNLMGDPDREPLTLPGHYVDYQTGCLAYTSACSLEHANEANSVDLGMLETVMALSQFTTVMWHCSQQIRSRHGNDFWSVVPTNLFRCIDGWVYINIVPGFWDEFTTFLEMPELLFDERFTTNTGRMANRDVLHQIVADRFLRWTRKEIQEKAQTARIPVGASLSFDEVLADVHLEERNFWQEVSDGTRAFRTAPLPFAIDGSRMESVALSEIEHG